MSRELFPVVEFTADAFLNYATAAFPRSRERALRRAIEQRCIVAGDLPSTGLLEINREGLLKLPSGARTAHETIKSFEHWEDTCLGRPFESTVLEQGHEVLATLHPILQTDSVVQLIDPYLTSYCFKEKGKILGQGLVSLVNSPGVQVRAVNAITKLFDRNQRDTGRFCAQRRARDVAEWLNEKIRNPKEFKILLHERPRNSHYDIHDRFLGFNSRPAVEHGWHALAIGYGLTALTSEKRTQTCMARITAQHFLKTWRSAEEGCTWLILRSTDRRGIQGWRQVTQVGNDIRVFQKGTR